MNIELKNWILTSVDGKYSLPVSVPGDVTAALYAGGYIEDPLFGTNAKNVQWIANQEWIYTTDFTVTEELMSMKRVFLCFDGADTLAEVWVNGVHVGSMENMFRAYRFDIKPYITLNTNRVQVRFPSSTAYIRAKHDGVNYRELFSQDRIHIRKAQCHWGWDWAPNLPGIGLYLPVYIDADMGVRIDNVRIHTNTSGHVRFLVELENGSWRMDEGCRIVVEAAGQTAEVPADGLKNTVNLCIPNPELWWPNGYGSQHLYDYSVSLYCDGVCLQKSSGRFGIRQVELIQPPVGADRTGFTVRVNGKDIFCKGSNWVPISNMTGAIRDSEYEKLLYSAKMGNFNMLRVWGGGIYEKEIFYDLCDQYGIMVWQDFMFACSAIPTQIGGMEEKILPEIRYQIKRLQRRTSIVMWCGGNEYMPHLQGDFYDKGNHFIRTTLQGMCADLDGSRPYIHNSPYGLGDDEWNFKTGDSHVACMDTVLSENDIPNFRKYISANPVQFVSESAVLGPTRLKSLKKFIPEGELWPTGESWDYHFVKNPYAIAPETFLQKEKRLAKALFGDFNTVQDFVKKAMLAHAQIIEGEIDFARYNPNCSGFMNWMYNDNWGCGTWSVIDCYHEKKPAYYAMRRAFAPVRLCFTEQPQGIHLCLVGTDAAPAVIRYMTYDGQILLSTKQVVNHQGITLTSVAGADYIAADCQDVHTIFHLHFGKNSFVSDLTASVQDTKQGSEITVRANQFARCVFIDCPDSEQVHFTDNYFDLEPGQERVILATAYPGTQPDMTFTVKTIADIWEE